MEDGRLDRSISLTFPADITFTLVARMALSGFGMLAGLDVDMVGDLRTIADECCDCLLHQPVPIKSIEMVAEMRESRLCCRFCAAQGEGPCREAVQDVDTTRCILETLLPDVQLHSVGNSVCCVEFSMPV